MFVVWNFCVCFLNLFYSLTLVNHFFFIDMIFYLLWSFSVRQRRCSYTFLRINLQINIEHILGRQIPNLFSNSFSKIIFHVSILNNKFYSDLLKKTFIRMTICDIKQFNRDNFSWVETLLIYLIFIYFYHEIFEFIITVN